MLMHCPFSLIKLALMYYGGRGRSFCLSVGIWILIETAGVIMIPLDPKQYTVSSDGSIRIQYGYQPYRIVYTTTIQKVSKNPVTVES